MYVLDTNVHLCGFGIKAHAVVNDLNDVMRIFFKGRDFNRSAFCFFRDAVLDGVLDQGLQGDLGQSGVKQLIVGLHHIINGALPAQLLDAHVGVAQPQLLLQGDDIPPTGERQLVELGQGHHDLLDLVRFLLFGHPADHVQRVVQEVRIDLALQRLELRAGFGTAQVVLGRQHALHFIHHRVVGRDQLSDLILLHGGLHSGGGGSAHRFGGHVLARPLQPFGDLDLRNAGAAMEGAFANMLHALADDHIALQRGCTCLHVLKAVINHAGVAQIEATVKEGNPVYLTKNGYGTMVVMSLDSYSQLIERVEKALDEADKLAEETSVRYTHEEVFGKIRDKIK